MSSTEEWNRQALSVLDRLKKLEERLKDQSETYQKDREDLLMRIEELKRIVQTDIAAVRSQLEVHALGDQVQHTKEDARFDAIEKSMKGGSKLMWILIGGAVGTTFAIIQVVIKFAIGMV